MTWASPHEARGSPAVVGDTAYVATAFTAEAVDLSAAANEFPWEDPDDDEPAHATEGAATEWSVPAGAGIAGPRVYRSPAVSGATVYVTLEREDRPGGELRAVTHAGEREWTKRLDRAVTELAGAGETVLAVTHDRSVEGTAPAHATLAAFDLSSGKRLWERPFEDHVEGVAVAGGTVYATAVTGRRENGDVTGERLLALG